MFLELLAAREVLMTPKSCLWYPRTRKHTNAKDFTVKYIYTIQ